MPVCSSSGTSAPPSVRTRSTLRVIVRAGSGRVMSDPYSKRVRELFATTPHAGVIDDGIAVLVEDQGVRVELSAKVDGDRVTALKFRAWGCPHLIAAAEAFCTGFERQQLAHLKSFTAAGLM